MGTTRTFNRGGDFQDKQTLHRLEEVHKLVHELARIILPSFGEFTSVWEITNRVVDHYHHPKAA